MGYWQSFQAIETESAKNMLTNMEHKTMVYRQETFLYISIFKKGDAKKYSNYKTIVLISHTSKVVRRWCNKGLTLYGARNARCTSWIQKSKRHSISNLWHLWFLECSKEFQKKVSLCFIDQAFDRMDQEKLWVALKEMGVPQRSIVLMHSRYCEQEALSGQHMERLNGFP